METISLPNSLSDLHITCSSSVWAPPMHSKVKTWRHSAKDLWALLSSATKRPKTVRPLPLAKGRENATWIDGVNNPRTGSISLDGGGRVQHSARMNLCPGPKLSKVIISNHTRTVLLRYEWNVSRVPDATRNGLQLLHGSYRSGGSGGANAGDENYEKLERIAEKVEGWKKVKDQEIYPKKQF